MTVQQERPALLVLPEPVLQVLLAILDQQEQQVVKEQQEPVQLGQ
jgi:hypothetical protein